MRLETELTLDTLAVEAPAKGSDADDASAGLAFLTLSRPEKLNALSSRTLEDLVEAARYLDAQLAHRVVIVRAEGRAFSAGADLTSPPEDLAAAPWQSRREASQRGLRAMSAIEQMRALTIAQVQGYAIGGGLLLMLACDLRVAADDVVFFIPEVELGLPLTWGGVPRLVREIGPALTKELVITCRRFGAGEAARLGLLNRVVEDERLPEAALELARTVLRMPAGPTVMTKDQVNAAAESMAPALTSFLEADALVASSKDPGARSARAAYIERSLGKKD